MAVDVELAEIRDFLAAHPPFDALPVTILERLPARLSIEYVRRGRDIVSPGRDAAGLLVVRSGAVDIRDARGRLVDRGEAGACVGASSVLGGHPSSVRVTAIEDCLLLVVPAEVATRLAAEHEGFAAFFDSQRSNLLRGALELQRASATGGAILQTRVREMLTRPPVATGTAASVREAAATMAAAGVSSLLVMDGERLVGIVTDRDLRHRVLAAGLDPSEPVTAIMTREPVTGSADALAVEVLLEMVARNIHHLPIVQALRPIGVVTTTDLVRLEHSDPVYLVGDIGKQPDVAGVASAGARLAGVVEGLVVQDVSAQDIARVVTGVGDAVERRLLELAEERLGPPPVPYCWVTLGSRARHEQALAADQDNALVLSDDATDEHAAYFEALATFVVDALVACGYPRCAGNYMATNPDLRQTLDQWRAAVADWVADPTPDAVRQVSVFVDLRPVHGDAHLVGPLAAEIARLAPASRLLLARLAEQAVENEPPLGFFRGFVLEKEGEHRDTLDVKRGGIGAIVELSRVLALSIGTGSVGTLPRIDAAVTARVIGPERGADLRDAFEFISYLRLRHQAARVRAGDPPDSFLDPAELSASDKRHLRAAFGIIRSAQTALSHLYPVPPA